MDYSLLLSNVMKDLALKKKLPNDANSRMFS